jgi:hypothetical protein
MTLPQLQIVFLRKRKMVDTGVQMIHPSIANLLPHSTGKLLGEVTPSGKGIFYGVVHCFEYDTVFGFGPLAFS